MSKLTPVIIGLLVLIGVGVLVVFQAAPSAPNQSTLVGPTEPAVGSKALTTPPIEPKQSWRQLVQLELTDYNYKLVTLADFVGKPLVINSWAAWCPFCVQELVDFAKIQQEFKDKVVIIAINRAETLAAAKKFTDKAGVTDALIFLLDPADSFYRAIGGFAMPETIFIDRNGNIREHKRGPMDITEIRQKVQRLLGP